MRSPRRTFVLISFLWGVLSTASPTSAARATPLSDDGAEENTKVGTASWYGGNEAGRRTASGAIFDPTQLTAAHRTLPLGTCVRVTNLGTGHFVIVLIIDRGPYIPGRIIDLSEGAARMLGMLRAGLAQVRIDIVASCLKEASAGTTSHS
jgi:rare lipoprotein A